VTVAPAPRARDAAGDAEPRLLAASARSRLLALGGARGYRVEFERALAYEVVQAPGPVFDLADATLAEALEDRPVFAVVDRRVDAIYGTALRAYAATSLRCVGVHPLHAAEATKSLATVEELCAAAHAAGLPRDGVLLGIGGGVTLDQTGLAAALYRRGVRYARVPTTLVGIVDVGVGIKQAVNAEGHKSLLGAFYPAYANVNDVSFLASLPEPALACGLAEMVKMALICDARLFALLEAHGAELLASRFQDHPAADEVIARAQVTMLEQLRDNLYEDDRARAVDFGHTFSPQLEVRTGYALAHGEAVAADMALSTAIAVELGLCDARLLARVAALLRSVALPVAHDALDRELALGAVASARAHRDGALNLVVPSDAGSVTFVQDAGASLLGAALARVRAVCA
jgi:2-epi-5-epi-valiolone synthase